MEFKKQVNLKIQLLYNFKYCFFELILEYSITSGGITEKYRNC